MPRPIYEKAHASARFAAPDLDPLEITLLLRIPPDHQHRRGEPRLTRSKKGEVQEYAPYAVGMWSISSKEWVRSRKLATHLVWLLEQLEPRSEEIASLTIPGLKIDFFCFSEGATENPPAIPRAIRERAARLGITIGIDHHDSRRGREA